MPRIFLRVRFGLGDGEKLGVRHFCANGLGGERQNLGLPRIAPERQNLYESTGAISPVGIIQPHRITVEGELVDPHAPLQALPDAGGAKNLVGAVADCATGRRIAGYVTVAWRLDMVAVEA